MWMMLMIIVVLFVSFDGNRHAFFGILKRSRLLQLFSCFAVVVVVFFVVVVAVISWMMLIVELDFLVQHVDEETRADEADEQDESEKVGKAKIARWFLVGQEVVAVELVDEIAESPVQAEAVYLVGDLKVAVVGESVALRERYRVRVAEA